MQAKNKNLYIRFFLFCFVIVFFFISSNKTFAATLSLSPSSGNYSVGDTIKIKIIVSSDTPVNAVSSKISFSNYILSLSSISKSGSIISLWAQEPTFSNGDGTINLEGVILNGYTGNYGEVATLIFKAKREGQAEIKFSSASVLANDGNGTEVISGNKPSSITITKAIEKPKEQVVQPVETSPVKEIIDTSKDTFVKVREIETTNNLPDYSLVIILVLIIILILILLVIYGIYYINKLKNYIRKRLTATEEDVHKNFETLEKDIDKEIIISRKMKENEKLTDEEMASLVSFKKDIKNTEDVIENDLKDIEKNC